MLHGYYEVDNNGSNTPFSVKDILNLVDQGSEDHYNMAASYHLESYQNVGMVDPFYESSGNASLDPSQFLHYHQNGGSNHHILSSYPPCPSICDYNANYHHSTFNGTHNYQSPYHPQAPTHIPPYGYYPTTPSSPIQVQSSAAVSVCSSKDMSHNIESSHSLQLSDSEDVQFLDSKDFKQHVDNQMSLAHSFESNNLGNESSKKKSGNSGFNFNVNFVDC